MKLLRFFFASVVCTVALLLPYRLRLLWYRAASFWVHLPFKAFGLVARFVLSQTDEPNPYRKSQ